MVGVVIKGIVSAVSGSKLKVSPCDNPELVTFELQKSDNIKEIVKKGDTVAYCVFPDNTGLVIAKLD